MDIYIQSDCLPTNMTCGVCLKTTLINRFCNIELYIYIFPVSTLCKYRFIKVVKDHEAKIKDHYRRPQQVVWFDWARILERWKPKSQIEGINRQGRVFPFHTTLSFQKTKSTICNTHTPLERNYTTYWKRMNIENIIFLILIKYIAKIQSLYKKNCYYASSYNRLD